MIGQVYKGPTEFVITGVTGIKKLFAEIQLFGFFHQSFVSAAAISFSLIYHNSVNVKPDLP